MQKSLALIFVFSLTTACGDDDRGSDAGRIDGGGSCTASEDCDDGHECTIDMCEVGGRCGYTAINERCTTPQICEVGRGCVDEASCTSAEDCDDGFECTLDSCGVGGDCSNMPLNELCSSVGPGSMCDPTTGMTGSGCTVATGCMDETDCDDMVDCTIDSCGVDMMCDFTPVNERCADGETCTATGCFESIPCDTDMECEVADGNFCNGAETCMPEFGCQPASMPRTCDDSDPCTVDSCDGDADMCVFRCDPDIEGCDCPMGEVPCAGTFAISPMPAQDCSTVSVSWNVREATFLCVGDQVRVDVSSLMSAGASPPLTQAMRSDDGTFDVSAVISGTCDETYRLVGSFTDADTFTGTWSVSFTPAGVCDLFCPPQTVMVTGTRI